MGFRDLFTRATPREGERVRTLGTPGAPMYEFGMMWSDAIANGQTSSASYVLAMSIPGMWRGGNLVANTVGGLPWYQQRGARREPAPKVMVQPAPPELAVTSYSSMILDLLFDGNGIAVVAAREASGIPSVIVPVSASKVSIMTDLRTGKRTYAVGGTEYPPEDVIHVKGPCEPGAARGMGILETHFKTLDLAHAQIERSKDANQSGVPTGVITVMDSDDEFDADDAATLKRQWMAGQRNRTVQVITDKMSFQPLSWSPEAEQLVEARNMTIEDIARLLNLDPYWLGAQQSSRTYSNLEQEAINLVKFSLNWIIVRLEQAFSAVFPRGTQMKLNLDALLRGDTLARYRAHAIGIKAGFLLVDEARALEDREPLTPEQKAELAARNAPAGREESEDVDEEAADGVE